MRAEGAPRRTGRIAVIAIAALTVAATIAGGWLVVRAVMAKNELEAAVAASDSVSSAIKRADLPAAAAAARTLQRHAAAADSLTAAPIWRVAEIVPVAGANLTAVRVVSAQVHALARDVANPLLTAAQSLEAGSSSAHGTVIDTAALAGLQGELATASASLETSAAALAGLNTDQLLPALGEGVARLSEFVGEAKPSVRGLADASAVLPSMLGQEAPRTLLIMLQNNAELRTGGGITGTFIQVRADKGALKIVAQADSSDFASLREPIMPVAESTTALYGDVVGRFVQNTSISADFTVTAELASRWWSTTYGVTPDAVIAVDPLVLKALLETVGPVSTPEGTLSSDNLVSRLLVEPYRTLDADAQTGVFEDAATAVFDKLTAGGIDPVRLAGSLASPVREGRVSVWSSHADEQAVLAGTELAGPAARHSAAGDDAYAVYFNDATGGKMDTLLDVDIASGIASCRADGRGDVVVSVTLSSRAGADAAALPISVTGGGVWGTPPGHIATTIAVSAPPGTFFGAVTADGAAVAPVDVTDAGFPVSGTQVDLAPGQSKTVEFRFISAQPSTDAPVVLHTPLVSDPTLRAVTPACP